jgi:hypothetical protein
MAARALDQHTMRRLALEAEEIGTGIDERAQLLAVVERQPVLVRHDLSPSAATKASIARGLTVTRDWAGAARRFALAVPHIRATKSCASDRVRRW